MSQDIYDLFSQYGTPEYIRNSDPLWPTSLNVASLAAWEQGVRYSRLQSLVMEKAYCYPVIYDTTGRWKTSDVSPACNCLANSLVQYRVQMNGVLTKNPTITSHEFQDKKNIFVKYVADTCLSGTRTTVVEDTLQAWNTFPSNNVVMNTAAWNTVGCTVSAFRRFSAFDQTKRTVDWMKAILIGLGFFCFNIPTVVGLTQTVSLGHIILVISTAVYGVAMFSWQGCWGKYQDKQYWSFRDNTVFWFGMVLSLVCITLSKNVLTQARDNMYNIATMFLAILVALMGFKGDYVHVDTESGGVIDKQSRRSYLFNWLATVAILYFAFGSTHINEPVNNFSNSGRVATLCLQIMLAIPFLQIGGLDMKFSSVGYGDGNHAIFNGRVILELVARTVFTVAVIIDLFSVGQMVDFIEVKDMN